MKKTKKKNPLRVGKKTYGTIPKDEAFIKAFEPYFDREQKIKVS